MNYLTTRDIAKRLSINPVTVRRWIEAGKIPAVKIGGKGRHGRWRVKEEDLERFINPKPQNPV